MTAGGAFRHGRTSVAAATAVLAIAVLGASSSPLRADAQSCLLTCSPAAPPAATGSSAPDALLGIPLPCLICSSQPQLVSICGITAYCTPRPTPAPARASPRSSPASPTPAGARSNAPPASSPAVVPLPSSALPAATPAALPAASADSVMGIPPTDIAALSPVSGLSFGGGLLVWPVVVVLDAVALIVLVVVLRRVWSRTSIG